MTNVEKPTMEKYGYHISKGFDDEPTGWMYEGGEDAYYKALKEWEDSKPETKITITTYKETNGAILKKVVKVNGKRTREREVEVMLRGKIPTEIVEGKSWDTFLYIF